MAFIYIVKRFVNERYKRKLPIPIPAELIVVIFVYFFFIYFVYAQANKISVGSNIKQRCRIQISPIDDISL